MKHRFARILISHRYRLLKVFAIQCGIVAVVLILLTSYTPGKLMLFKNCRLNCNGNITDAGLQWLEMPDRMLHLNKNPVYAQFDIPRRPDYPKCDLLIIVSSAPKRHDRRMAIRETWWQQCGSTNGVRAVLSTFLFIWVLSTSLNLYLYL